MHGLLFGDIAADIVAAMQAYGGLVTYADLTNYRTGDCALLTPFHSAERHAGLVAVAPPGASGVSVLQQIAIMEALGWTNGPTGTWDSLHYWHARAEASRMMWKEHFNGLAIPGAAFDRRIFSGTAARISPITARPCHEPDTRPVRAGTQTSSG